MSLYQVTARHMCAAFETEMRDGIEIVVLAAPILGWTKGKSLSVIEGYCYKKGWHLRLLDGLN